MRIGFGVVLAWECIRYFVQGWIREYFVEPSFHFTYWGFDWVHPWPGVGMYVHFAVLGVLAACVAAGLWYRVSVALFCLGFTYAHLVDKTNYLNHYYLVSVLSLLMVFLPLDRAGSLDVWRRPARRRATVPAWVLWTLRLQIGLVYVFGGIAKLNADWLLAAQPLRLWLAASTDLPVIGTLLGEPSVAYCFSWAGALFDLTIVFFLVASRTRVWAYGAVVVFTLLSLLVGWWAASRVMSPVSELANRLKGSGRSSEPVSLAEHFPNDEVGQLAAALDDYASRLTEVVQRDRGDRAKRSENRALDEQLLNQASAAGADGEPHADLAAPRGGAREQHSGDIRAGNQQHEADDRHQPRRAERQDASGLRHEQPHLFGRHRRHFLVLVRLHVRGF